MELRDTGDGKSGHDPAQGSPQLDSAGRGHGHAHNGRVLLETEVQEFTSGSHFNELVSPRIFGRSCRYEGAVMFFRSKIVKIAHGSFKSLPKTHHQS